MAGSVRILKSNNANRSIPEKNRTQVFVGGPESGWAAAFGLTHPLDFCLRWYACEAGQGRRGRESGAGVRGLPTGCWPDNVWVGIVVRVPVSDRVGTRRAALLGHRRLARGKRFQPRQRNGEAQSSSLVTNSGVSVAPVAFH